MEGNSTLTDRAAAMLNLYLAGFWLVAGVVLLLVYPERGLLPFPLYWIAFGMCAFNLVRWWALRTLRKSQQESWEAMAQFRRPLRRPGDDRDPDPDFRLTDEPPPHRDKLTQPGGNGEAEPK